MRAYLIPSAFLAGALAILFAPAGTAVGASHDVSLETPAVLSGGHSLSEPGFVTFIARFRDARGVSPQEATVVVEGVSHSLSLVMGKPSWGNYQASIPNGSGCREYYFQFVDSRGSVRRYPASGSLVSKGEGGCPVDYLEESLSAGERQEFGFFMIQEGLQPGLASTSAHLAVYEPSEVRLTVHDVSGRVVRELFHGEMSGGIHDVNWDGRDQNGERVSAGVYFYRFRTRPVTREVALRLRYSGE